MPHNRNVYRPWLGATEIVAALVAAFFLFIAYVELPGALERASTQAMPTTQQSAP